MIPPLDAGSCQLWWAWASAANERLLGLLDERERDRHRRFLRPADRALFAVSHALTRIVAAHHAAISPRAVRYADALTPGAKPRFADPAAELQFSISHSGARVVVAISRAVRLGVDVERIDAAGPDRALVASVLHAAEHQAWQKLPPPARAWAFCRYWTRKEAVLKATGDGLEVSPAHVAVSAPTAAPALVRWSGPDRPTPPVHLYDLDPAPGYAASLATLDVALARSDHDGSALLEAAA